MSVTTPEIEVMARDVMEWQRNHLEERYEWWKYPTIDNLLKDLGYPRKKRRDFLDLARKGKIPQHLRYMSVAKGNYTAYYAPVHNNDLPKRFRRELEIREREYGMRKQSNGLKDLLLNQLDMAFDAAVHEKTAVVFAVTEYVVSQFYKGVIWLPLHLHPDMNVLLMRDWIQGPIPPWKNLDSLTRMLDGVNTPWGMCLTWLLEVQTQIAKQGGRYPRELGGVTEEEMRKINELTYDVGSITIPEGRSSGDPIVPELFEMGKRLIEGSNIDLQGLVPPAIEWGAWEEDFHDKDQGVAHDWLVSLFDFLNDDLGLWIILARKRIAEEKEAMKRLGIVGELTAPIFWKTHGVDESEASPEILDFNKRLRPPMGTYKPKKDKPLAKLRSATTEIHDLRQRMRSMETREPEAKTSLGRKRRAKKEKED